MPSPPRCCRAASADFATALPTLPPHCRRSPPLSLSLPSLSRAANAAAAMPAVAASLPRCLHCSDDAATTLPTLPPCCHRRRRAAAAPLPPPSLPPCHPAAPLLVPAELPPLTPCCRCRHRAACHHCAAAALLLPTMPLRWKKHVWPRFESQKAIFLARKTKKKSRIFSTEIRRNFCETFSLGQS